MSDGLFSAAAGLAAQQLRIDMLASDLANVNTTGYRRARIGFSDLLYAERNGARVGAGVRVVDAGRSLAPGAHRETGEKLDLAIEGPGFFQVRRPDGSVALTRDGSFRLDVRGEIVTAGGERLVPPIVVPRGTDTSTITIRPDGTVTVPGRTLGRIAIVDVSAPTSLEPAGSNLFLATERSGAPVARPTTLVRQGMLEASNVDMTEAMTSLIEAQRAFELAGRAVKMQDQLMEIANGLRR